MQFDYDRATKSNKQVLQYDKDVKYYAAFVPLKEGDQTLDAIVYLYNDIFCGGGKFDPRSGQLLPGSGCSTLILSQDKNGWKFIGEIAPTHPPILVLESKSHGWHSIGVCVYGETINAGYEAVVRYDGEIYPYGATVPPARPLELPYRYQVVIPPEKVETQFTPPTEWLGYSPCPQSYGAQPMMEFAPAIEGHPLFSGSVSFDPGTGLYTYGYVVNNLTQSTIREISILVGNAALGAPVGDIQPIPPPHSAPGGWYMHGALGPRPGCDELEALLDHRAPCNEKGGVYGFYEFNAGPGASIPPGASADFSVTTRFAPTTDEGLNVFSVFGEDTATGKPGFVANGSVVVPSGADWDWQRFCRLALRHGGAKRELMDPWARHCDGRAGDNGLAFKRPA